MQFAYGRWLEQATQYKTCAPDLVIYMQKTMVDLIMHGIAHAHM